MDGGLFPWQMLKSSEWLTEHSCEGSDCKGGWRKLLCALSWPLLITRLHGMGLPHAPPPMKDPAPSWTKLSTVEGAAGVPASELEGLVGNRKLGRQKTRAANPVAGVSRRRRWGVCASQLPLMIRHLRQIKVLGPGFPTAGSLRLKNSDVTVYGHCMLQTSVWEGQLPATTALWFPTTLVVCSPATIRAG